MPRREYRDANGKLKGYSQNAGGLFGGSIIAKIFAWLALAGIAFEVIKNWLGS